MRFWQLKKVEEHQEKIEVDQMLQQLEIQIKEESTDIQTFKQKKSRQ